MRRGSRIVAAHLARGTGIAVASLALVAFTLGSREARADLDALRCQTSGPIAYPSAGPRARHLERLDRDGDGLFDAAETELAACVVGRYRFDRREPARRAAEPELLFAVYPAKTSDPAGLVIAVDFVELYAKDGGFAYCFPESNGCNHHPGDAQRREFALVATSLTTAKITHAGGCDSFDGTHVNFYPSWGKHHVFCRPLVCDDPGRLDACDCGAGCGFGHRDRADGRGAVRTPVITADRNVGQLEDRPAGIDAGPSVLALFDEHEELTARGFVNHLARFGFPDQFVYDACGPGELCDPGAPEWRAFRDGKAWFSPPNASVHRTILRPAPSVAIHLHASAGGCMPSIEAPLVARDGDGDGDGVPDACDPCMGSACGSFADVRRSMWELGVGVELDDLPVSGIDEVALSATLQPRTEPIDAGSAPLCRVAD